MQQAYVPRTGESRKRSMIRSTITADDVNRLKVHKYFLKWVGCTQQMREHSRSRHRSSRKAPPRKQESAKRSASRTRSQRDYPDSQKKRTDRTRGRSALAADRRTHAMHSRSGASRLALDPQKVLAREFRQNNLKMKALRILYRSAFESHKLVVLREHLRQQTRANIITRTFVRWIEAYSERMKQKARQEWLLKKRQDDCLARVFRGWQNLIESRRAFRNGVRAVVPMRCLLRLIAQQDHVPAEALDQKQHIGQELQICTQFYEMRSVDERVMHESLMQFQSNLVAAVFQALKPDHLKHPARDFVQNRHRFLSLKRCWEAILDYSQEHRVLRVKFKHLSMIHQARVKNEMLQTWLQHLTERNSMMRKALKAGQHFRPRCTRKYFERMRTYIDYRRAKAQKSNFYRMTHQEKIKRLAFIHLYSITTKLRDLDVRFEQVHAINNESRRRATVRAWSEVAAKTKKARLLYEWNLKVRTFALQKEATI